MTTADTTAWVRAIQQAYPRIWFACHREHRTRATPHASGITDRESGILAHLDGAEGIAATALAKHLGIGKASLSQHLKRLESLGLIEVGIEQEDKRRKRIRLSDAGRDVLSEQSPLDAGRLRALLDSMPTEEAADAVRGLRLLADAARRLPGSAD
ncbi:MAG: MarR family winged helix-turn-helix transcriptional regulator [Pseudomonadota bacterium]